MAARRRRLAKLGGEKKLRPYPYEGIQREFDRMIDRFQHEFDEFWQGPPRMRPWMRWRQGWPMIPYREEKLPLVDLEDRGKDYRLTVDLLGFTKENVDIEVADDWVTIHAKKAIAEEEKKKNYIL